MEIEQSKNHFEIEPMIRPTVEEKHTEKHELNVGLRGFYSFLASLMGLGFGFAVSIGALVFPWDCTSKMVMSTNSTIPSNTTASQNFTSPFVDGHLLNTYTCFGPHIYSLYISIIFAAGLFVSIINFFIPKNHKRTIIASNLLFAMGFGMNFMAMGIPVLAIFARFLQGCGTALMLCTMVVFITQNAPKKIMTFLTILGPSFISIGAFIDTLFGLIKFSSVHGYSYVLMGYAVFFFLLAIAFVFYPENKNTVEKDEILPQTKSFLVRSKENLKGIFIVFLLHAGQQLSFINGLFMYSHMIFRDSQNSAQWLAVSPKTGTTIMAGLNALSNLLSTFCCVLKMDKKILYYISHIGVLICLICLGIDYQQSLAACIHVFFFSLGLGPLVWSFTPSFFQPDFQKEGIAIGTAINMLFSFLIPYFFKALESYNLFTYLYFGAAAIMFMFGLSLFKLMGVREVKRGR